MTRHRKPRMVVRLVWALVVAVLLGWGWTVFDGWRTKQAQAFVSQVLLPQVGSRVSRWEDAVIGVGIETGTQGDEKLVAEVVTEINAALAGTGYRLDPTQANPPITLYLRDDPGADGAIRVPADDASFWTLTDDDHVIREAVVLVSETFEGEARRSRLLRELARALGLGGAAVSIADSLFHEPAPDTVQLTRLDAKLLRFLYRHGAPGMDATALRDAFDAHWLEMR